MNVYLLTRYGNGEDQEGPDSSLDTHMLVRASTLDKACALGEPVLEKLPAKKEQGREVANFFQVATVLGQTTFEGEHEAIICFPWYASVSLQKCARVWKREALEDGWETFEEYHGSSPLEY